MSPARGELAFDGSSLGVDPEAPGRRFRVDARCLEGEAVGGAYAHVCASADPDAAIPYDSPEVQQARRDALAWWIPMLGDCLVCISTIALDSVLCGGAITVAREPVCFHDDPFSRLFAGTIVVTDLFSEVPPPPGPVLERYRGIPWPGGHFPAS